MDHFLARDYLPQTGRFNGSDPIMEYSNPYSYVANRPMNFVDPLGMKRHREYGRNEEAGPVPFGLLAGGGYFGTSYYVDGVEVTGDFFYSAAGAENLSEWVYNNTRKKKKVQKTRWVEGSTGKDIKLDPEDAVIEIVATPLVQETYWEWVETGQDETNIPIDETNNPYYESPSYIDAQQQINELWVPTWATPAKAIIMAKGMGNAWNYFKHINKGKKVTTTMYEAWKLTNGFKMWQAKSYLYNNFPLYANFANSFAQGTANGNIPSGILNKIAYGLGYIVGNNPFGF